jgi:hypothetical protein
MWNLTNYNEVVVNGYVYPLIILIPRLFSLLLISCIFCRPCRASPVMKEVGPYVYRKWTKLTNVTFSDDDNKVSYVEQNQYEVC